MNLKQNESNRNFGLEGMFRSHKFEVGTVLARNCVLLGMSSWSIAFQASLKAKTLCIFPNILCVLSTAEFAICGMRPIDCGRPGGMIAGTKASGSALSPSACFPCLGSASIRVVLYCRHKDFCSSRACCRSLLALDDPSIQCLTIGCCGVSQVLHVLRACVTEA